MSRQVSIELHESGVTVRVEGEGSTSNRFTIEPGDPGYERAESLVHQVVSEVCIAGITSQITAERKSDEEAAQRHASDIFTMTVKLKEAESRAVYLENLLQQQGVQVPPHQPRIIPPEFHANQEMRAAKAARANGGNKGVAQLTPEEIEKQKQLAAWYEARGQTFNQ